MFFELDINKAALLNVTFYLVINKLMNLSRHRASILHATG